MPHGLCCFSIRLQSTNRHDCPHNLWYYYINIFVFSGTFSGLEKILPDNTLIYQERVQNEKTCNFLNINRRYYKGDNPN